MTLHVLDIPDDARQLPDWLEGHLFAGDLSSLVAQLTAVHSQTSGATPNLDEVLGERRKAVLHEGLSKLSHGQLAQLMTHPQLLLDLQDLLIVDGGANSMQQAERSVELRSAATRGRGRMLRQIVQLSATSPANRSNLSSPSVARKIVWAWAIAATLLLGFFSYERFTAGPKAGGPATVAWGWANSDALPQSESREAYLNALADGAHQWFNKRPSTAIELAQRLTQLRQGCATLLLSQHKPLSDQDRSWLSDRCRDWANKFDTALVQLETGKDPVDVREEVDSLVKKLIDALHKRASVPPQTKTV